MSRPKIKALAVDDETVSRVVLKRMLETLGMDVVDAADVPEAIEKLQAESFDLVVSDYLMPSGTGLDVAEVARSSATPFILLTGFGHSVDRGEHPEGLVAVHLTKPVSTLDLAAAVADCGVGTPKEEAEAEPAPSVDLTPSQADLARNQSLLEAIGVEVTMVDRQANVLATTAAYRLALGYDEEFWESSNLFDLAHPDDVAPAGELLSALLDRPGESLTARFRARHAHGHWEVIEVHCTNLLEHPGVGTLVLTTRAVTTEEELRAANEEARQRAASQAEYVASVSHELRSPLQGILGVAQLLEPLVDGEAADMVEIIQTETERLRMVIDDLLDYAKLGQGAMELLKSPTSARKVIGEVERIAKAGLNPGVTLSANVAVDVPAWVSTDQLRLHQILLNLVSNAVRHTDAGTVEIKCQRSSDDRLLFTIVDTGVGIEADRIEGLFQPFQQGTPTERRGGTGLGLTICKNLIELMGGRLGVESQLGQGSKFSFAVKAPETAAPEDGSGTDSVVSESSNAARALVIDDGKVNRMVIGRQLETMGFEVDTADGGALGAEMAIANDYQLIIADWHMPEVDGLEAIGRIRAFEQSGDRHTPIVSMTASAMPGDKEKCLASGADDFLAKPATRDELFEVVGHYAHEKTTAPTASVAPGAAAAGLSDDPSQTLENVFNAGALADLVEQLADADMVLVVVDTFLEDLDERVTAISSAIELGEDEKASRAAHMLKAPSMMLGAVRLGELCQEIESATTTVASAEQIEYLRRVAERTCSELEHWANNERKSK